jgi:hypothetical protein
VKQCRFCNIDDSTGAHTCLHERLHPSRSGSSVTQSADTIELFGTTTRQLIQQLVHTDLAARSSDEHLLHFIVLRSRVSTRALSFMVAASNPPTTNSTPPLDSAAAGNPRASGSSASLPAPTSKSPLSVSTHAQDSGSTGDCRTTVCVEGGGCMYVIVLHEVLLAVAAVPPRSIPLALLTRI